MLKLGSVARNKSVVKPDRVKIRTKFCNTILTGLLVVLNRRQSSGPDSGDGAGDVRETITDGGRYFGLADRWPAGFDPTALT